MGEEFTLMNVISNLLAEEVHRGSYKRGDGSSTHNPAKALYAFGGFAFARINVSLLSQGHQAAAAASRKGNATGARFLVIMKRNAIRRLQVNPGKLSLLRHM